MGAARGRAASSVAKRLRWACWLRQNPVAGDIRPRDEIGGGSRDAVSAGAVDCRAQFPRERCDGATARSRALSMIDHDRARSAAADCLSGNSLAGQLIELPDSSRGRGRARRVGVPDRAPSVLTHNAAAIVKQFVETSGDAADKTSQQRANTPLESRVATRDSRPKVARPAGPTYLASDSRARELESGSVCRARREQSLWDTARGLCRTRGGQ